MHLSRPPARAGLLAAAVALIAVLVAAPGASAASFDGGPFKVDFKTLANAHKLKVKTVGADSNTKTGGTFELGSGSSTMVAQPSGNLPIAGTSTRLEFSLGKKKATLTKLVFKLTAGKGTINATIGGKTVSVFDVQSQGKARPASDFTTLGMTSSAVQVSKSGAAALNKAFGLKRPARGKPDRRIKAKQKAGTASMTAHRSLKVQGGGQNKLYYDKAFRDKLRSNDEGCSIELSHVEPATPIAEGPDAPAGGVNLVFKSGTLNATNLAGSFDHDGGTSLDRGPGNPQGAEYHTKLTQFNIDTRQSPPKVQAFSDLTRNTLDIGFVEMLNMTAALTDTGGTVTITGVLALSDGAGAALSALSDPDGPTGPKRGCQIPAGSKIGNMNGVMNVL